MKNTFTLINIRNRINSILVCFILCFIGLSIPYFSFGQDLSCGTASPTDEQLQLIQQQMANLPKNGRTSAESIYLPIKLHLVTKSNGTGGVDIKDVLNNIASVNRLYINSGMQFFVCGNIDFIPSDQFYNFKMIDYKKLSDPRDMPNVINVYFTETILDVSTGNYVGGFAFMNLSSEFTINRIYVINSEAKYTATTLHHELGHNFGLLHTFENSDHPIISERELVARTNCNEKGDLLCDTPADPYRLPGITFKGCTYTGTIRDVQGNLFNPPMDNIMSYYGVCVNKFSPMQYQRINAIFINSKNTYSCNNPAVNAPIANSGIMTTSGVQLQWTDRANNELGYFIERSSDASSGFAAIAFVEPNISSYLDKVENLDNDSRTTYYYRIKPVNSNSSFSNVIAVNKLDQTITFPVLANKLTTDAPFNITATASSGLKVAFSIVSGPASIKDEMITIKGPGTVTVRATQTGNGVYKAGLPVEQSFIVNKTDQVITFGTIPQKFISDPAFSISALANSGLPVTFTIVSGPAKISGNTITLSGQPGIVIVKATQTGNITYNPAPPIEQSFCVVKPAMISLEGVTLSASPGKGYQWILNEKPIAGATSQYLTTYESGEYKVEVTDNNDCSTTSEPFQFVITSISEDLENASKLYPNPTNGVVYVQIPDTKVSSLQLIIYDALGRMVYTLNLQAYNKEPVPINISGLKNGTYWLLIKDEYAKLFLQRIFKQ